MILLPSPPEDSIISVKNTPDSTILKWYPEKTGIYWLRLPIGCFLLFWLCGWAAGEFFAGKTLLDMIIKGKFEPATIFLVIWLTFWTIGGIFAGLMLLAIFLPARPAILKLDDHLLTFTPGLRQLEFPHKSNNPFKLFRSIKSFWNRPFTIRRVDMPTIITKDFNDKPCLAL
ncbi:MAG: hypothetical protein J7M18_08890, partial [Candidatus Eremiobacteraeota bacterium]|nr:hypothetical protein [Candidatus Eremiobacteraeota bacterium]